MVSFTYEYVVNAERLGAIANEIADAAVIALDCETLGFDPYTAEVRLLSINTGKGIYVIDAFQTKTLEPVISALRESKGVKTGQNLKFDQKMLLHHYNLELWPIFDTYRASNLIYNGKHSGRGSHDLWALYNRELNRASETDDLGGSDWSAPVLTKAQLDYAAEDVVWLPKLREVLRAKLLEEGLGKVALIEFGAILPEAAMELAGFAFDKERWLALAEENVKQEQRLRRELISELPHPAKQIALPGFEPDFNLGSPQQLLQSLHMLGLKIDKTNEITLAMFAKEFPIVEKILEYRGFSQSVKTFGRDYLENVHPVTGRIHTSFYPFTGAGRYSSSKPNLQQIPRPINPKRKPYEFRECFGAGPGKKLIIWDFSQIELRVAAEIADDETLMGVYSRGEDAHAQTASLVSHVPLNQITKVQRQMAKALNFGLIFGMSAPKLVLYAQSNYNVVMSLEEAETFRRRYFDGYAGIQRWHRKIFSDEHKKQGIVRTVLGRLRYLSADSHNEFSNTPVQGCLPGHVKVLSKNGLRAIEDLPLSGEVWTGTKWAPFIKLDKGEWERAELIFSNGAILPCDTRHKVLVERKDSYEFVEFSDLSKGDKVCFSLAEPIECGEDLVSNAEAYWLGFAVGNGHSDRNYMQITFGDRKGRYNKEDKALEWSIFVSNLGLSVRKREEPTKFTYVVENKLFRERWEAYGYNWEWRAHSKRIPTGIWNSSLSNRIAFLLGLLDADGHIGDNAKSVPNLHMCQRELLEEVQILARTLGVESILRGPYEDAWRLDFNGGHLASIGYGNRGKVTVPNQQAPAFVIKEALSHIQKTDYKRLSASQKTIVLRLRSGGTTSVYTLKRLLDDLGIKLKELYATSTLVSKHSKGFKERTFTLAVDDPLHRFDSQGVISKNSAADGLKRALSILFEKLRRYNGRARMVMMVHDEIVTEVDDDSELIYLVNKDVKDSMIEGMSPVLRRVPVVVEGGVAETWAEK